MAHFFGDLASISVDSASRLRVLAAAAALVALVGCGDFPSLNPESTARLDAQKTDGPADPSRQSQPQPGAASSVSVDRIAYIAPYGDLFTVNPDGTGERRLTGVSQVRSRSSDPAGPASPSDTAAFYTLQDLDFSESYAWPTWSPDGTRLAVSRVQITPNRSLEVSVQVIGRGHRGRTGPYMKTTCRPWLPTAPPITSTGPPTANTFPSWLPRARA